MRIGIGYDIHRLVEERLLVLGGIEIPYIKGLLGYSDGDALLHAISDAILGAMAMGDIGELFPNTDPQFKDISSSKILNKVVLLAAEKGYVVNNVDTVILAEEPKIYPFKRSSFFSRPCWFDNRTRHTNTMAPSCRQISLGYLIT